MCLVKKLVDCLGSEITVESKLGEGTSIRITLPVSLACTCGTLEDAKEESSAESMTLPVSTPETTRRVVHVLMVEDDFCVAEANM